jgi:hypothetical protein
VELLVQARHRLETMLTAEFLPKLNWSLPIFYLFYLQHQFNGCLYKIKKKNQFTQFSSSRVLSIWEFFLFLSLMHIHGEGVQIYKLLLNIFVEFCSGFPVISFYLFSIFFTNWFLFYNNNLFFFEKDIIIILTFNYIILKIFSFHFLFLKLVSKVELWK